MALTGRIAVVALLGLSLLTGCGFTPLYATPGLAPGLAGIEVVAPRGRVGYLLREDLDDELARDKSAEPTWRLTMDISQTRSPRGLSQTDVAQRYDLGVTVKYTLTEIASGRVAHAGQVFTEVSYDAASQPYAGIAARQDSQQRVAADAARRIRLDLSVWLARQSPH